MKPFCLTFNFLFGMIVMAPFMIIAQLPDYKSEVRSLFDQQNGVNVEVYSGFLAEVHRMDMFLGIQGNTVKGLVLFQGDELLYSLEGFLNGEQIKLLVINEFEDQCAKLELLKNQQEITGLWWNNDEDMKFDIELQSGSQPVRFSDIWLKKFSLKKDGHYESMILESLGPEQLFASYYSSKIGKVIENEVICRNNECSQFDLYYGNDQERIKIKAALTASNKLNTTFELPSGNLFKQYDFETELFYHPIREISYSYRIDVLAPKLSNSKLNAWISDKVTAAVNDFKTQVRITEKEDGMNPGLNLKFELIGWTEVSCLTNSLLSGAVILINNLDYQAKTIFFNFNLQDNKTIDLLDFLKPDLFEDSEFRNYIHEEINNQLDDQMVNDEKWLNQIDIKPNFFNEAGIVFSSGYHSEYGMLEATVPFQYLEQKGLKRNHPFQKLITLLKS